MLFYFNNIVTKNFSATCAKEKPVSNSLHIHLIGIIMQNFFGGNPFVDGIIGHSLLLSRAFFGGNPFVGGILGHNLLLSLAFFRWNPFVDGIFLGQNLLLSRASFFTMEFRLSRSLSHELFSFFTMGFRLSQSLSHELFSFFTMELWKYAIWGKTLFIHISQRVFT
jgi:hypothetical protein